MFLYLSIALQSSHDKSLQSNYVHWALLYDAGTYKSSMTSRCEKADLRSAEAHTGYEKSHRLQGAIVKRWWNMNWLDQTEQRGKTVTGRTLWWLELIWNSLNRKYRTVLKAHWKWKYMLGEGHWYGSRSVTARQNELMNLKICFELCT